MLQSLEQTLIREKKEWKASTKKIVNENLTVTIIFESYMYLNVENYEEHKY